MNLNQKITNMMVEFEKKFDVLAMDCYIRHQKSCRATRRDMRIEDQQNPAGIIRHIRCTKCDLGDTQYVEFKNLG